jgi:hypothetical protein
MRCGSSDAGSIYSGGSFFCFSCGYFSASKTSPYLTEEPKPIDLALPEDAGKNYGQEAIEWIGKYGLSTTELLQRDVLWSEAKKQLLFTFKDSEGQLLLWQARNFYSGAKLKYFTKGTPDSVLPMYGHDPERTETSLVLVEDCVSAMKIARQASAMPVLGSGLSRLKLARLRAFWGPSSPVVVWLDGNMFHKAQTIAWQLCLLGCDASAVYTEMDPKCYSNKEIAVTICNSARQ